MKFDYSIYFRQDCCVPLSIAAFTLLCTILTLVGCFVACLKNKVNNAIGIIKVVVFLALFCFDLGIQVVHLSRGGIYLLSEKEEDQIRIEGTVEEMFEIGTLSGAEYYREDQYRGCGHGEALVVNGEKWYLITYGDTKVGDYVYMSVLPRSHFVMELRKTPD